MDETPANDGSSEELSQESLQVILANYKKALEQEFDLEVRPELVDPEILTEAIKKQMIGKLPVAFKSLAYLAEHADSESVRLSSSKFIIECAIGKQAIALPGDPLSNLLKNLTPDRDNPKE